MPSDLDLVRRIRDGDAAAFDALYARHRDTVRRRLVGIVRDAAAADDLTQETFLRLWTRAETCTGAGSVRGWLLRIATNLALNHLRGRRRRPAQPLAPAAPAESDDESLVPAWMIDAAGPGPDALAEVAEQQRILRDLLDGLSEAKRETLRLVYDAALELAEAADRLGVPEGTVKSRLYYATRDLARAWPDEDP